MTEGWISVVKVAGNEWIKMDRYKKVPMISSQTKESTGGCGGGCGGNYEVGRLEKDNVTVIEEAAVTVLLEKAEVAVTMEVVEESVIQEMREKDEASDAKEKNNAPISKE